MKVWYLGLGLISFSSFVSAIGQLPIITFESSPGAFRLAARNSTVQIIVDDLEWPAVKRAANNLALDFGRVTNLNGSVLSMQRSNDSALLSQKVINVTLWDHLVPHVGEGVIIAGTLGRSSLIDELARKGKIRTERIVGQWESFTSTIVDSPVPEVSKAFVIAGSDRRGTVYGLYDISEQIGVSPWHWFADVPSKYRDSIYAYNITKIQNSPSVKYRGFFINDEAPALTSWMNARYPKTQYGSSFGADFYSHVFELLLRLRANYLWPAMWGSMFNMDDPRNQKTAHEFGIIMGTSHTEPMMRATGEQTHLMSGPWQWDTNNASMYSFMQEGANRAREYESYLPWAQELEGIFKAEREILGSVYGDPKKVPQVWTLYTEVQSYYDDDGLQVPDDVTLLWADDNFGNMRRLPVAKESNRSGGAGVYYHFDFVGPPRNYKWINTIQLQKTWEQLYTAYQRQARAIWMVNVGDIKGLEIPTSHFFDLAYDITRFTQPNSTAWWLRQWATREFGSGHAKNISAAMIRYSYLAGKRKFELVDSSTYSVINYDEGNRILEEWQALGRDAQDIYNSLSDETKAAFFEMVLHPILAGGNHYDIAINSAKNKLYAFQGRNSANALAEHVLSKWKYDHELATQYDELLGGKWKHMMDQPHFYNNYWQQPMRQLSPNLHYLQPLERSLSGDMGIAIEGTNASIPGDDQFHSNSGTFLEMRPMDPFGKPRWIEVFAQGTNSFTFKISADSFVNVTPSSGIISPTENSTDIRVSISIDWSKAPAGSGTTRINIASSSDYGTQFSAPYLLLPYNHTVLPSSFTSGFVESDATIAMEAEHYTRFKPDPKQSSLMYMTISDYGKTLSGVTLSDPMAPTQTPSTGPSLEYDFFTFTSTTKEKPVKISLVLSPSLNTTPGRPLKYAVSIDGLDPRIVQFVHDRPKSAQALGWPNGMPAGWEKAVTDAAWTSTSDWVIGNGSHTLRFWALEPGVVLQRAVIDLGGVRSSYLGPPETWRVGSTKQIDD